MPGNRITDLQMTKYKKLRGKHTQEAAAAKTGISVSSARRIESSLVPRSWHRDALRDLHALRGRRDQRGIEYETVREGDAEAAEAGAAERRLLRARAGARCRRRLIRNLLKDKAPG